MSRPWNVFLLVHVTLSATGAKGLDYASANYTVHTRFFAALRTTVLDFQPFEKRLLEKVGSQIERITDP